jgi:hypothetical protein
VLYHITSCSNDPVVEQPHKRSVVQEEGAAVEEDVDDEFDMEDDDYYQGENYGALATVSNKNAQH